jgi:hypothetical protein
LKRSGIVICLAGTRHSRFVDKDGASIVAETLLACGHPVISFDLPNHGEYADAHGEGLNGMAAAVAAGHDVFEGIRAVGSAAIDWARSQDWGAGSDAMVDGVSRGGHAALHLMAADSRVIAGAIHAPVTHLPALREYSALASHPIIQRANAESLIDKLADRPRCGPSRRVSFPWFESRYSAGSTADWT